MEIAHISRPRYLSNATWTVAAAGLVVAVFAFLARGTLNLRAALTEKPDIAVYLLLEKDGVDIDGAELLREKENERDYLVQSASGQLFVKLKKGEGEWYVAEKETMRE